MKTTHSLLSVALLAAAGVTFAATHSPPSGQRSTPNQDKGSMPKESVESRAEVKADAKAARADPAASMPVGQRSTKNQDKGHKPAPSAEMRSDVKADSKAAKTSGGDKPEGQESVKDQNKGGGRARP